MTQQRYLRAHDLTASTPRTMTIRWSANELGVSSVALFEAVEKSTSLADVRRHLDEALAGTGRRLALSFNVVLV